MGDICNQLRLQTLAANHGIHRFLQADAHLIYRLRHLKTVSGQRSGVNPVVQLSFRYFSQALPDAQFSDLPPAERYALTDRCLTSEDPYLYARGARLYPNVRETLLQLKARYFIGLVSNCTESYALAFLHAHGLTALFDDHETAGRTGLGKGDNIRLLMTRNQIEKAVYIGDTAKDLSAAQEANIPFLYASWGFGDLGDVQPRVDAFSELAESVSTVLEG